MAQIRDLTVVALSDNQFLLTAVDISAAIGEKEFDVLSVQPELTGKLTTRVALLEIIASGADVVAISDVIGAEMNPTGKRIIAGIKEELQNAELSHLELNGSTEENMMTSQTSEGVMVIGVANASQLKINNISDDALLFGYGEPRMGQELLEKPDLEVSYNLVRQMLRRDDVLEIVPIGSKGIEFEATQLARLNSCSIIINAECSESWLVKSAGPSTSIIVAVIPSKAASFQAAFPDAFLIGEISKWKCNK